MTTKEFETLKKIETAKMETLELIVKALEELKKLDEEAAEWVVEKINE